MNDEVISKEAQLGASRIDEGIPQVELPASKQTPATVVKTEVLPPEQRDSYRALTPYDALDAMNAAKGGAFILVKGLCREAVDRADAFSGKNEKLNEANVSLQLENERLKTTARVTKGPRAVKQLFLWVSGVAAGYLPHLFDTQPSHAVLCFVVCLLLAMIAITPWWSDQ